MNRIELRDYLIGEIEELLDVGNVGLYEFVDSLRNQGDLSEAEMRAVSREALDTMLMSGRVRLEWAKWNNFDYAVDATGVEPNERDWKTPTQDSYLAIAAD